MKKLTLFILLLFTMASINAQLNIVEPTFYGKYRITAGAKGVSNGRLNTSSNYNITVEKPIGATTIHKVYIYKAYIPDDDYITNGNLTINGLAYTLTNSSGSITTTSNGVIVPNLCYYKEVSDHTTLINKLNSVPIGPVNIAITEPDTLHTDGVGIVIVWNVPTGITGSYFIMIGSQLMTKDGFSKSINVAPIDISNPALKPILGIGINFSTGLYHGLGFGTQLSEIRVNNNLITSKAGGSDDGGSSHGETITLGGYGDDPDFNDTDELYNIKSQLTNGVSSLNFTFKDVDNFNDDHLNVIYFDGAGILPPSKTISGLAPGGVSTGLSYWYRADKNTANAGAGTDVTGWTDMWNETTVSQLGTNALPKYVLGTSSYFNFNPGINFTANTQTLGNNTVRTLTSLDYDVFTFTKEGMTRPAGFFVNPRYFSIGMDNTTTNDQNWDGFGIFPENTNLERRPYGGFTQYPAVAPAFSTTIPSIMYFRNTNTATSKGLNGAAMLAPTSYNAVGNMFGGHIFGDTRFSSNGSDNEGFTGHIGEAIIYGAGTLSNVQRRRVDSYLAIKYGITLGQVSTEHYLDTDGNIVWNGTSNTAYNNNIFGVARDDIEVFEQKVSKSVNVGTILTVATINDFLNPNQAAARTSFSTNKTYFLLGDNANVTNTPVNVTVGAKTYGRIPRIWMVQEKNADAGNLFYEADLTSYTSGTFNTTSGNVVMLVADNAAFTTNVTVVNPTSNSAAKWVYNQNVADGKYITFAIDPCSGPDSDGDGTPDMCDLDDDNDGILDTAETAYWENVGMTTDPPATIKHSQGLQITTSKTGTGDVNKYYDPNVGFDGYEPKKPSTVTYNFSKTVYDLKLWMNDMDALEDIRVNYYDENNNRINNLIPYVTQTYQSTAATLSNDATYGLRVVATRNANGNSLQNYVQILTPFGVSRVELTFQASSGTTSTPEYYIKSLSYHLDTDGDGIPNHLDLDSDNDGCLDAIEGSENVTTAMLVPAGGTVTVGVGSSASNQNLCASGTCVDAQGVPTVVNTGGAADTGNNQGQDIGYSQSALMNECDSATGGDCTKPGTVGTPLESSVGILTKATKAATWPESVPNGYIVLDSAEKGFVITHMTTIERHALTPVEGMLIYNTTVNCVQLYRGASPIVDPGRTGWNCIERACGIAPRNVNIGYWGSGNYNIFSGHANFKSQLDNTANYSTSGIFKGISGWNWINANTDINATAAAFSATQLKAKYDMIVTGWQEMTAASALKIKQYTDLGGVVLVLMDAGEGPNLNVAFGGTSALGTGVNATPGQKARSLNNQISNEVFGIGGNATLYGTSESSRPPITAIPPGAFITSYLNTSGSSISTVNDTGTEFVGVYITGNEGRAIFVYDEGIYRHSSVAGTVIDTPQEIFLHNLMSYALQKVGFSTQ